MHLQVNRVYARYGSRLLVWFASLSLLVAFIGALAVQFIGGAGLLKTAANVPYDVGLLIFVFTIAIYTTFGGFCASVLNDAMHGVVMLIGTVLLLVAIISAAGSVHLPRRAHIRHYGQHQRTPAASVCHHY